MNCIRYHRHGDTHRIYGPAEVWPDGDMFWTQYDIPHRLGGPAEYYGNAINYYLRGIKYSRDVYEFKISSN